MIVKEKSKKIKKKIKKNQKKSKKRELQKNKSNRLLDMPLNFGIFKSLLSKKITPSVKQNQEEPPIMQSSYKP